MTPTSATTRTLIKRFMPVAASWVNRLGLSRVVRYAETGSALLQGKGAGSGWDMASELRAAAACIHRSDPIVLDVGANYGKWSQGMFRLFPAAQQFVLIEPQADCLSTLAALELPGKIVVPCAMSDHTGKEDFFVSGVGWGAASLYHRKDTFFVERSQHQITVPVSTLDEVLERQRIQFVDFAKFDIEGAELAAFRGAARTFSRGAIGALSIEFGSGNINSRTFFRDFWDLLTGYGFEMLRVLPGGRTLQLHRYDEDLEYFRGVSNYVCRTKVALQFATAEVQSVLPSAIGPESAVSSQ